MLKPLQGDGGEDQQLSLCYKNWTTDRCILVRYVTTHQDASVITLNDTVYLWIRLNGAFVFTANRAHFWQHQKVGDITVSLKVRLFPSLSSLKTECSATFPRCGYIRLLQRDGRARKTSKTSNYSPPPSMHPIGEEIYSLPKNVQSTR